MQGEGKLPGMHPGRQTVAVIRCQKRNCPEDPYSHLPKRRREFLGSTGYGASGFRVLLRSPGPYMKLPKKGKRLNGLKKKKLPLIS